MKKIFLILAVMFAATMAKATEGNYTVGFSSYMTTGVRCSTGTVIQINSSRPAGFAANVAGYTISISSANQIAPVWIGGPSVSTATQNGDSLTNLGAPMAPGTQKTIYAGKDLYNLPTSQRLIPIYCRAADGAGVAGTVLAVEWFGY